jgi:hypothetical protein
MLLETDFFIMIDEFNYIRLGRLLVLKLARELTNEDRGKASGFKMLMQFLWPKIILRG